MDVRSRLNRERREFAGLVGAFRQDENGATAIEYSLIVSLIFLTIVAAVRSFTASTSDLYGEIDEAMSGD